MNEWNIQSRSHGCQECEVKFSDKEIYHTILVGEKDGYGRLDVCQNCWDNQFSEGASDRKGFISYWKGVYEAPPPAPPEPIKKEGAESLLRKLIELKDPKYGPAIYILAAMLERKRLLKVKEQFENEGQRVFVYEQPKTGDILTVSDPDLHLDELEAVQKDVADLLEHGLNPSGPTEDVPSEADESSTSDETETPEETESNEVESEEEAGTVTTP